MTTEVLNALVMTAKKRIRKTKAIFDDEVQDLLLACEQDLLKRNAVQPEQMAVENIDLLDPLIKRAMMTYVKAYFGQNENAEHYIADYNIQKGTLMSTSGYTRWSDEAEEDEAEENG